MLNTLQGFEGNVIWDGKNPLKRFKPTPGSQTYIIIPVKVPNRIIGRSQMVHYKKRKLKEKSSYQCMINQDQFSLVKFRLFYKPSIANHK